MAKSAIQLRKKLQEKSAECELYKRKYMSALFELNKQILENLDAEKTFSDGGFIDDDFTHNTLKAAKKQEEEKGFSDGGFADKDSYAFVSKHKVCMIDECDFSHYDTKKHEVFLAKLAKMAAFPKKP